MNIRHQGNRNNQNPGGGFGATNINSTVDLPNLPQFGGKCLAGSSKMAPRIFISSIVLGAECLFFVKFLGIIIQS